MTLLLILLLFTLYYLAPAVYSIAARNENIWGTSQSISFLLQLDVLKILRDNTVIELSTSKIEWTSPFICYTLKSVYVNCTEPNRVATCRTAVINWEPKLKNSNGRWNENSIAHHSIQCIYGLISFAYFFHWFGLGAQIIPKLHTAA